jgi:hypothetical protein
MTSDFREIATVGDLGRVESEDAMQKPRELRQAV